MARAALAGLFAGMERGLERFGQLRARAAERFAQQRFLQQQFLQRAGLAREQAQGARQFQEEQEARREEFQIKMVEQAQRNRLALMGRQAEQRQRQLGGQARATFGAIDQSLQTPQIAQLRAALTSAQEDVRADEALERLWKQEQAAPSVAPFHRPTRPPTELVAHHRQQVEILRGALEGQVQEARRAAGVTPGMEAEIAQGRMGPYQVEVVLEQKQEKQKKEANRRMALIMITAQKDAPTWLIESVRSGEMTFPQAMGRLEQMRAKQEKPPTRGAQTEVKDIALRAFQQSWSRPIQEATGQDFEAFAKSPEMQSVWQAFGVRPEQRDKLIEQAWVARQ